MGKAMFYHLTRDPLEVTARNLLARAYGQKLRVTVRGRVGARMEWLDQVLWLGETGDFLPHGLSDSPHAADQPILLTTAPQCPNAPAILMLIDSAEMRPEELGALERLWVLFDGNDPEALAHARGQWKAIAATDMVAEYWSQDAGRWEMKAQSGNR
jgi:DNA polymerase III subunit chi